MFGGPAGQGLAGEFDAAGGTRFHAEVVGAEVELPEAVKTALFRITQEAVRNAVKHGGAAVCVDGQDGAAAGKVELRLRADARSVHVDVLDRGPGVLDADLPIIFLSTETGRQLQLAAMHTGASMARSSRKRSMTCIG